MDWTAVSRMTPAARQVALLAEAEQAFARLPDDAALAVTPSPVRVLWLLSWLDSE